METAAFMECSHGFLMDCLRQGTGPNSGFHSNDLLSSSQLQRSVMSETLCYLGHMFHCVLKSERTISQVVKETRPALGATLALRMCDVGSDLAERDGKLTPESEGYGRWYARKKFIIKLLSKNNKTGIM